MYGEGVPGVVRFIVDQERDCSHSSFFGTANCAIDGVGDFGGYTIRAIRCYRHIKRLYVSRACLGFENAGPKHQLGREEENMVYARKEEGKETVLEKYIDDAAQLPSDEDLKYEPRELALSIISRRALA